MTPQETRYNAMRHSIIAAAEAAKSEHPYNKFAQINSVAEAVILSLCWLGGKASDPRWTDMASEVIMLETRTIWDGGDL